MSPNKLTRFTLLRICLLYTSLAKNLTLTTRLGGVVSKRSEPSTPGGMDSAGFKAFSSNALRFPGLWATKLEDGSYGLGPKVLGTPLAWLDSGSFYDENFDKFRSNVELAFTPVKLSLIHILFWPKQPCGDGFREMRLLTIKIVSYTHLSGPDRS